MGLYNTGILCNIDALYSREILDNQPTYAGDNQDGYQGYIGDNQARKQKIIRIIWKEKEKMSQYSKHWSTKKSANKCLNLFYEFQKASEVKMLAQ